MRAWRVFLSSVNFSLIVNFIRDFSLFSDYILVFINLIIYLSIYLFIYFILFYFTFFQISSFRLIIID